MRTFSRADWSVASEAWREGGFDDDTWSRVRYAAAVRGMLYPPSGSPDDDIEDPRPSQRAIIYRAMRDTPRLLFVIIGRATSWSQVTGDLIAAVNAGRVDVEDAELRQERQADRSRRAGRNRAPQILREIIGRIAP